ncbi:MAG: VWA domain-containing protein, partial [Gammaproteobacteria bacterium]|nr:VWA domain-containing protein [Gammaproteobacteria bacterium]
TTDPIQISFDNGTNWTTVTPTNGSFEVVIPAGKTTFEIKVPSKEDWNKEGTETYNISATIGGQTHPAKATGTIIEFDAIRVSEEGLLERTDENDTLNINDANGIEDDTGTNTPMPYDGNKADTTNSTTATGTLDFDTDVAKFDYVGSAITSNGKAVNWAWDSAEKELVGTVSENGKTAKVMTIELDDADTNPSDGVDYKATLHQGIDHNNGDNIENVLDVKLRATDTNGDTGTFVVGVEDDMPYVTDKIVNSPSIGYLELNLVVTLDVSKSMLMDKAGKYKGEDGFDGTTRLSMAKDAITGMLDTYRSYGDIKVKVVKFATTAGMVTQADEWVSVANAITAINNISIDKNANWAVGIGTGTNYDAGLAQTMEAFDKNNAGYIAGADNQIFFLTDGNPEVGDDNAGLVNGFNKGHYGSSKGIDSQEETLWTDFLKDNKIKANAVGFGGDKGKGNSIDPKFLHPIAFDGRATDENPQGKNLDGKFIEGDLALGLQELIEVPPVKKDLVNNKYNGGIDNAFGGDGASVTEVTVEGKTYSYNNNSNQMTNPDGSVTTGAKATIATKQGSELVLDLSTGKFNYFGAKQVAMSGGKETLELNYKVQDQDGDFATSTTTLNFVSSQDFNTDPFIDIMAGKIPNDATEGATNDLTYVVKYQEENVTKGGGIGTNSNVHVSVSQKANENNITPNDIESISYTDSNTGQQKVLTSQAEIQKFFTNGIDVKIVVDTNKAPPIIVRPKDDSVLEHDEVLELTISKPANSPVESVRYQIGFEKAFGTVHDNDLMPVLPIQNESVVEATGATVTKTLTVTNPQNVEELTIGGKVIADDVSTTNPVTITTDKGTLLITGYDKTTGVIRYKYTENGSAKNHSNGDVIDNFVIGGTDNTGNALVEGKLAVSIIDTEPTARHDDDSITENETAPATGNVITGDDTTNIADGKDNLNVDTPITVTAIKSKLGVDTDKKVVAENAPPQTVEGKYGTLTINSDGSYEYILDNANPAVQALDKNEKLADKFEYTITDADGDESTSTLNMYVEGVTDDVVKPVNTKLSITRTTDASIDEKGDAKHTFVIKQTAENSDTPTANNAETTVTAKIDGSVKNAINKDDIKKIVYTDAEGTGTEKVLSTAEIDSLFNGSFAVTIPAGSTGVPKFDVYPTDDGVIEKDEVVKMTINNSTNANSAIVTDSAEGTINDPLYIDINSIAGTNQPKGEINNSLNDNQYGKINLVDGADVLIRGKTNAPAGSTITIDISMNAGKITGKTATVKTDGTWEFNLTANQMKSLSYKEGKPLVIKASVTDNGVTVSDSDKATVILEEVIAKVSEEGLTNGIADTDGTADTTDSVAATGKIATTNPITDVAQPITAITSGGKAVTWTWDSANKVMQGRDSDGNDVIKINLNDSNTSNGVDYKVTLQKAIDHPVNSEEDTLNLVLKATDSAGEKHDVKVVVEDDSPVKDYDRTESTAPTKNVILTLDASEAMNEMTTVNGQQVTKWQASIDATLKMLEKQDAEAKNIKVMINKFSDGSSDTLTEWMSYDDAVAYLQSATVNGGESDWAGGLTQLLNNTKTAPTAEQTYHYFITADNPTGYTNKAEFTSFFYAGKIGDIGDKYNIGDDNWVAVSIDQGASYTRLRRLASNTSDVIRPDADDLETELVDSVKPLPLTSHTGYLLESESNLNAQIGADTNGYISKIVLEGKTYTYDIATNKITLPDGTQVDSTIPNKAVVEIVTDKNSFVQVDMKTGQFIYNPSATAVFEGKEDVQIDFQLTDGDGDVSNMLHYTFTQSKPTTKSADPADDDNIVGYSNDVEFTYTDTGDGYDTLLLNPNDDVILDFDNISAISNNIEEINMEDNSNIGDIISISASDVLSMTDSDNELFIKGDANDTVDISGLSKQTNSDHIGYDMYTDGNDVTLYIDTDINYII